MILVINIVIVLILVGIAVFIIVRNIQKSHQDHCAACEYTCEAKRLMKQHQNSMDN